MWFNLIIKRKCFEVHVQSASKNISFVVWGLLRRHSTTAPSPGCSRMRGGVLSCARCFVFSALVSTGALFLASGCESGVPEEAAARQERREQELRPLREAAERQRGAAVLTVPYQPVWHLLTAPLASGGRQDCSVVTRWFPVVYWHWVAYKEWIPSDAFCQILLFISWYDINAVRIL